MRKLQAIITAPALVVIVLLVLTGNANASEWRAEQHGSNWLVGTTNDKGVALAYVCQGENCAVIVRNGTTCTVGQRYPVEMTVVGASDVSGNYSIEGVCMSDGSYALVNHNEPIGNRGLFYGYGWMLNMRGMDHVFDVNGAQAKLAEMLK